MSKVIEGIKYADSHEWVKVEGNVATIGISDYAQHSLGDIVYVDLPSEGEEIGKGEEIGTVTTGYHCLSVDKSVCMALIDARYSALETPVEVRIRKKTFAGKVVKKKFYQKNYKK